MELAEVPRAHEVLDAALEWARLSLDPGADFDAWVRRHRIEGRGGVRSDCSDAILNDVMTGNAESLELMKRIRHGSSCDWIMLKGSTAHLLAPELIPLRHSNDLDAMGDRSALLGLGMIERPGICHEVGFFRHPLFSRGLDLHAYVPVWSPDGQTIDELGPQMLLEHSLPHPEVGGWRIADAEMAALISSCHIVQGLVEYPPYRAVKVRLAEMCDFLMLIGDMVSWDRLWELANRIGTTWVLQTAISLARVIACDEVAILDVETGRGIRSPLAIDQTAILDLYGIGHRLLLDSVVGRRSNLRPAPLSVRRTSTRYGTEVVGETRLDGRHYKNEFRLMTTRGTVRVTRQEDRWACESFGESSFTASHEGDSVRLHATADGPIALAVSMYERPLTQSWNDFYLRSLSASVEFL